MEMITRVVQNYINTGRLALRLSEMCGLILRDDAEKRTQCATPHFQRVWRNCSECPVWPHLTVSCENPGFLTESSIIPGSWDYPRIAQLSSILRECAQIPTFVDLKHLGVFEGGGKKWSFMFLLVPPVFDALAAGDAGIGPPNPPIL